MTRRSTMRDWVRLAAPLAAASLVALMIHAPAAAQTSVSRHDPMPAAERRSALVITPTGISIDLQAAWDAAVNKMCIVCGQRPGMIEHSELHKGMAVPVCDHCVAKYQMNPEPYFAHLQPRSALFQDDYQEPPPVNRTVFLLGAYALLGVICAGIAGHLALRRGHPAWPYVLGGFVGTVLGVIVALRLPQREMRFTASGLHKIPLTTAPVPCAGCGHGNHPAAKVCSGCGVALNPSVVAEAETVRSR